MGGEGVATKKKGDAMGKPDAKARTKALREDMCGMQSLARGEAKAHAQKCAEQAGTKHGERGVSRCDAKDPDFSAPSSSDSSLSCDDSSPPLCKAPKMAPKALGKRVTHPKPNGKSR